MIARLWHGYTQPADEAAVVPPEARTLLVRYDARSVHYEVRELGTEGRT